MWRKKSKPATPATKRRKRNNLLSLFGAALLLPGCGQDRSPAGTPGRELRIAHLTDLAWRDRNRDGQPAEFMPAERFEALLGDLTSTPAEIHLLRGLGSEAALLRLRDELSDRSSLPWTATYIPGPNPYRGIGFLTLTPPESVQSLHQTSYAIDDDLYHPLSGGILLSEAAGGPLWLWNATLPEPEEAYEKRRNEARLLAQALRPLVEENIPVLLSVHCREEPDSPMIRMLTDTGLKPLYAEDSKGDRWTHRDPEGRVYLQDQLLFASPAWIDALPQPPRIHSTPALRCAGEFRHQRIQLP
jgi:hypothetical protein